jgi:hypothetical protein
VREKKRSRKRKQDGLKRRQVCVREIGIEKEREREVGGVSGRETRVQGKRVQPTSRESPLRETGSAYCPERPSCSDSQLASQQLPMPVTKHSLSSYILLLLLLLLSLSLSLSLPLFFFLSLSQTHISSGTPHANHVEINMPLLFEFDQLVVIHGKNSRTEALLGIVIVHSRHASHRSGINVCWCKLLARKESASSRDPTELHLDGRIQSKTQHRGQGKASTRKIMVQGGTNDLLPSLLGVDV